MNVPSVGGVDCVPFTTKPSIFPPLYMACMLSHWCGGSAATQVVVACDGATGAPFLSGLTHVAGTASTSA